MAAQISHEMRSKLEQEEVANLLAAGRDLSQTPYRAYRDPLTAIPNEMQRRAQEMANVTGQWAPYLQQAQRMGRRAEEKYPDEYRRYMNPYENSAVRSVTEDVNRNFTQNVLPAIEAHFIKRGQHGASKQRDMVRRASRDMQSELVSKLGQMRSQGYEMGARQHAVEQERMTNLAKLMAGLGAQQQAGSLADIEGLRELGRDRQQYEQNVLDTHYNQFLRQQAYPYEQLEMRSALLQGLPFANSRISFERRQPDPRLNTAGQLGSLAMALLGARQKGMFG